jgi:hypothetical protein
MTIVMTAPTVFTTDRLLEFTSADEPNDHDQF